MKKSLIYLLTAVLAWPGAAWPQAQGTTAAAAPNPRASGGSLAIGTRILDNEGWPGRVNEFEMNKSGARPSTFYNYWLGQGHSFLDFSLENRGDGRAQSHWLDADLERRIRIRSTMERYLHRLDHDPLTNLDAAKGTVIVRHDNLAPNRALVPGRNEWNTSLSGALTSWLRWRASHRFLQVHGDVQTRAISKCANCHVTGAATRIDQRRHELSAGLTAKLGRQVAVHYDFSSQQFREGGERPTNQYDVAQHPQTLSRAFFNRVLFDGTTDGRLPYAYVPGYRKDVHDVKLSANLPRDARLTAQMLKSSATNTHINNKLDVLAWNARYLLPLGERGALKAQFRRTAMESDDVFIQLEELVNPAGVPQAGQTYEQAYPSFGKLDWTRLSSINRQDLLASGEGSYRWSRSNTIRGGYQFRSIRRDHFDVERTDRNRLYGLLNLRHGTVWKARVRYAFEHTDRPFLHHKAALSPALQLTPSPGTPPSPLGGLQYFALYAARQADLTNQPTRGQYFDPSFTWTPTAKAALTFHFRMKREINDKLNFSQWTRDSYLPGAEFWFAPLERLNVTLSYQQQRERSNTLFVLPAFDG